MQRSYCYTPGVGAGVGVSVGVRMQNVRTNVKVMEFQSLFIFPYILTSLIILIKPLTTKAHYRRASGDCGTSGVQEAFILIMVLLFLSKLRSFLGLWQFVSLCLRSGEIHSRWRWIFLERVCLCLVWRFSRGSLGFLESSYIKGIPTADWFGQKRNAISDFRAVAIQLGQL